MKANKEYSVDMNEEEDHFSFDLHNGSQSRIFIDIDSDNEG